VKEPVVTDTLESLAADLARAAVLIGPAVGKVVDGNAQGVQRRWRSTWPWSGSTHLPHLGASVTVEKTGQTEAEVGPEKGGQGSLGHLIEYGTAKSGAHPGGGPAAVAQATPFQLAVAAAAEAVLGGSYRGTTVRITETPH
jgi:hypothetical protein